MTNWIAVLSAIAALVTAIGAASIVVRERNKPKLDKAQEETYRAELRKMADETNRDRDIWMRRLDIYLFSDAHWHRKMIHIFQDLQDRGILPEDVDIPPPPPVPEPPPYDAD